MGERKDEVVSSATEFGYRVDLLRMSVFDRELCLAINNRFPSPLPKLHLMIISSAVVILLVSRVLCF